MRYLFALAALSILSGCTSVLKTSVFKPPHESTSDVNNVGSRLRAADFRQVERLGSISSELQAILGLPEGKASPKTVLFCLSEALDDPEEVEAYFQLWLKGQTSKAEAQSWEDVRLEDFRFRQSSFSSRLLTLRNAGPTAVDFDPRPLIEALRLELAVPPSDDFGLDALLNSSNSPWQEACIYWLVHVAKTQPEYESAPFWAQKRDRLFRESLQPPIISTQARAAILAFCKDEIPQPDFTLTKDVAYSPLHLTPASATYYTYLRMGRRYTSMTRAEALFWAAALTLHFKSGTGATLLRQFRDNHAISKDTAFWKKLDEALAPLLGSQRELATKP